MQLGLYTVPSMAFGNIRLICGSARDRCNSFFQFVCVQETPEYSLVFDAHTEAIC